MDRSPPKLSHVFDPAGKQTSLPTSEQAALALSVALVAVDFRFTRSTCVSSTDMRVVAL